MAFSRVEYQANTLRRKITMDMMDNGEVTQELWLADRHHLLPECRKGTVLMLPGMHKFGRQKVFLRECQERLCKLSPSFWVHYIPPHVPEVHEVFGADVKPGKPPKATAPTTKKGAFTVLDAGNWSRQLGSMYYSWYMDTWSRLQRPEDFTSFVRCGVSVLIPNIADDASKNGSVLSGQAKSAIKCLTKKQFSFVMHDMEMMQRHGIVVVPKQYQTHTHTELCRLLWRKAADMYSLNLVELGANETLEMWLRKAKPTTFSHLPVTHPLRVSRALMTMVDYLKTRAGYNAVKTASALSILQPPVENFTMIISKNGKKRRQIKKRQEKRKAKASKKRGKTPTDEYVYTPDPVFCCVSITKFADTEVELAEAKEPPPYHTDEEDEEKKAEKQKKGCP